MGYEHEGLLYRAPSPPEAFSEAIFGEPLPFGLEPNSSLRGEFVDEDNRSELYVERGAADESGNQAPDVAVNGMALHIPQKELPFPTRSNTVLEGLEQKLSPEVSSGTSLSPATEAARNGPAGTQNTKTRQTGTRTKGVEKPPTEFRCEECTRVRSRIVSFSCKKSLQRHKKTTKAHDAPSAAVCRCGSTILRKDNCSTHRKHCNETWL
jgi:hypothetical protein